MAMLNQTMRTADEPGRWPGRSWSNFVQFYRDVYGQHVVETHTVGGCGAQLLVADQGEGDWSDAATPTLVLSTLMSEAVPATFHVGAGRFRPTMRPGEFILTPPHIATEIYMQGRHRLEAIALPFADLQALAGQDCGLPTNGDFGCLHGRTNFSSEVTRISRQLWAGARSDEPHGRLAADARILALLTALLQLRDGGKVTAAGGLAAWRLKRATEALADGWPTLGELAADVGLSASHFARAFKAETGLTPQAWATRALLERAMSRLTSTDQPIAEVAADSGFASQQGFTTAFRRQFGTTPARYRRDQGRMRMSGLCQQDHGLL